jgi:hypothetical protein
MRLDGDAPLTLEIHRVEHLGLHLACLERAGELQEAICQGRLAMVDVGDDREIPNETLIHQESGALKLYFALHAGSSVRRPARGHRQRHRHHHRVVRLLHLRHRRGHGLRPAVLPQVSEVAGTLASFATFGIGFIARPLGGVVMGHFGDRLGRKAMLVWALLLMGVATLGIGLLPTYATIGAWAPALLVTLRFVQGVRAGR